MFKKVFVSLLVVTLITLSACSSESADKKVDDKWLKEAKLNEPQSVEELYEAAKKEGKVVVYSMSSRIKDVKETFEQQYPGIVVEPYDMRMSEIFEKFQREHEAGIHTADVLFMKDADGSIFNEFFKPGLLHKYIPQDMIGNVDSKQLEVAYTPYFEMKQIFYNTEVYDQSPIDSWWDLTRPEYKGKVMLGNPLQTATIMGLFSAMIQNADEMEKAYEEEFGESLVLDGTENAGYEFIKRLVANDLILTTSDGDIIEAIGAKGQSDPPFGIATSSKMRKANDELLIGVAENVKPRDGQADPALLCIADKAEHVNAAKLLIRWIGGETDGTGPGFKPFHVRGSWPSRSDILPIDTPTLDTLNLWDLDLDYKYENMEEVRNYWLSLQ